MIERRTYRTARMAARFFRDARQQGYSPSLVVGAGEFVVQVWEKA